MTEKKLGCFSCLLCVAFVLLAAGGLLSVILVGGGKLQDAHDPAKRERQVAAEREAATVEDRGTAAGAYAITKQFIEDRLRCPATADWPWSPQRCAPVGESNWLVAGYVDSQNAFGATIRTRYVAVVQYHGNDCWSLVNLTADP